MTAIFTESEYEIELSSVQGPAGASQSVNYIAQSLTSEQQSQARTNISAASSTHVHGSITNDGKLGSTANLPLMTGADGVIVVGSFGTTANTFCQGNDSRLSDARTPLSHNHSASEITSGELAKARQHAQTAYLDAPSRTFTGATTFSGNVEAISLSSPLAGSRSLKINCEPAITGSDNVFIGSAFCMLDAPDKTGNHNTCVGGRYTQGAGHGLTSGENNTLIGNGAGFSLTTHSYNTMLGYLANAVGSSNIAIGYLAGLGTTGSGNIYLGNGNGSGFNESNTLRIGSLNAPTISANLLTREATFGGSITIGEFIKSSVGTNLSLWFRNDNQLLLMNANQSDWASLSTGALNVYGNMTADTGAFNGPVSVGPITKSALLALTPSATAGEYRITDSTPAQRRAYPDGSNWRYSDDSTIVT